MDVREGVQAVLQYCRSLTDRPKLSSSLDPTTRPQFGIERPLTGHTLPDTKAAVIVSRH